MASTTTYSFGDVTMVIDHPSYGQQVVNGQGIGSISITMTTERTAHAVAADGSILVSKVLGNNGSVALALQQTSDAHKWLVGLYNYILSAPTGEWAGMSITVRSDAMGDLINMSGVAPQKLPDRPYQAQGQLVTWTLLAAEVQQRES